MKLFYITLSLVIVLVSCNGNKSVSNGLDWNFYLKKSQGTTIKILSTIQDPAEFNYLKSTIKPLLSDSFKINVLIYYISKDKIVKALLDDSKKSNKVVYDIVIADPDIMQSLFSLGLLYGKYLNTLPNSKDLDFSFINSLNPNTVLRDYVVPYSCTQFVLLYDSCDISDSQNLQNIDLQKLTVLNSDYNIQNLYYINAKYLSPELRKDKMSDSLYQSKLDSINYLTQNLLTSGKDFIKSYQKDLKDAGIMKRSLALKLSTNSKIYNAKIQSLENSFPVYYKMSAITNTSSNVVGAMVVSNFLIDKNYQLNKYIKTNEVDLPVLNLLSSFDSKNIDSTAPQIKLNATTRSKATFSISDNLDAMKWWKEIKTR